MRASNWKIRGAVVACCVAAAACGGGQPGLSVFDSVAAGQPDGLDAVSSGDDLKPLVVYEVTGAGAEEAQLTYVDAAGAIRQEKVTLPWETRHVGRAQLQLYVSAQNMQEAGVVSATISLNGRAFAAGRSVGAFGIATASGVCC